MNEWLSVDLGSARQISSVDVYNSAGSCGSRLGAFELWLGSTPGAMGTRCGSGDACTGIDPTCGTETWCTLGEFDANGTRVFYSRMLGVPCVGTARFVTLRLTSAGGSRYVDLNEMVINGFELPAQQPQLSAGHVSLTDTIASLAARLQNIHVPTDIQHVYKGEQSYLAHDSTPSPIFWGKARVESVLHLTVSDAGICSHAAVHYELVTGWDPKNSRDVVAKTMGDSGRNNAIDERVVLKYRRASSTEYFLYLLPGDYGECGPNSSTAQHTLQWSILPLISSRHYWSLTPPEEAFDPYNSSTYSDVIIQHFTGDVRPPPPPPPA